MTHPADVDITDLEQRIAGIIGQGSSGRGNSFYAGAAECGRRQRLLDAKRKTFASVAAILPAERNKFLVGSVYHALQELYHSEQLQDAHFEDARSPSFTGNENLRDGWRLFDGWRRNWDKDFWGETIAVERQIPRTKAGERQIQSMFAAQYTARIDMLVRIGASDLPRIQTRLPHLRTPGLYLLDWKTRDSHGGHDAYINGLQALSYPLLHNLTEPQEPCAGIIWDVIVKHSRRKTVQPVKREDFDACFVSTVLSHHDLRGVAQEMRGMIDIGSRNYRLNIPNRSACTSFTGEQCQFRLSGACDARMQ
jgi:hypothetical protein